MLALIVSKIQMFNTDFVGRWLVQECNVAVYA